MVSDFYYIPIQLMHIDNKLKIIIIYQIIKNLKIIQNYATSEILHSTFWIKWSLIILNEFVPEGFIPREFAMVGSYLERFDR